jgi:hypothetical protein
MNKFSFLMIAIIAGMAVQACQTRQKADVPRWFEFSVTDLDTAASAIDMSFLNEEVAGGTGFVTVRDGRFVDGDGNRIRFLGTNLTFSSCFLEKDVASRLARRLRQLGYNVVRFHHMDMRSSPAGLWDAQMVDFDPGQLDKLDWLIYELKRNGIYTNLNLHVSYTYPGAEYSFSGFNFGKSIDFFYGPYLRMQQDYARRLLTHRNAYTGNTYAEEPAVAFVEINNENSLLSNWAHLTELNDQHRADLQRQWQVWKGARGKKYAQVAGSSDPVGIIANYSETATPEQKEMLWAFLMDREMEYTESMVRYLKDELNVKVPVSCTQASYSGVAGVWREGMLADFIDMHAYWEHPRFPGQSWSRTDWLIRNSSMAADKNAGTLASFGMHRVSGMPLTISEYDHPAPNFFCAEMYPMLASFSAFQDFDGIYHFALDCGCDRQYIGGFFTSTGHPLKQIYLPVAAVLFRMNAVRPGSEIVQLNLPEASVLEELVASGHELRLHGSNMKTIWQKLGAPAALPILHRMEVAPGKEPFQLSEQVAEPSGAWVSSTGEITWNNTDSTRSVFTIDAPAAKAAVGYIGGSTIELSGLTIDMDTTKYNWASIALASLDGKPISDSERLLLVAAGRVENTGMGWNEDRTSVSDQWGSAPVLAEGIIARLSMEIPGNWTVSALDPQGRKTLEVPLRKSKGRRVLDIGPEYRTLWYLLEK